MKSDLFPEYLKLAERQAALCRIFSNPQRVLILWFLAEKDRTVTEVATAIGASMQSASQHLRIMEFAGLVESRREHHNIFYHLINPELPGQLLDDIQQTPSEGFEIKSTLKRIQKENQMTTLDLTNVQPAKVVDARAMSCPGPLLEAKKAIAVVKVGEVLEIWSGDSNTKNDMPRWCEKVGHEFMGTLPGEGYERLFIRRKK